MNCIDVGCFSGDSVLHLIADPAITSIEAYEPNPRYTRIWDAIEEHYPNVRFHKVAVSNYNGKAEFSIMPEDRPLGSTITKDKRDFGIADTIEVDTVDIADIINEDCWLKLDAEGNEFVILERLIETGKLKYIKKLFIEWHTSKLRGDYKPRQNKILEELKNNNVEVVEW